VLGLAFGALELGTRGRHRLESLVVVFTALTFISGAMGTLAGLFNVLRVLQRPEVLRDALQWREMATVGAFESLGNVIAGIGLGTTRSETTSKERARHCREEDGDVVFHPSPLERPRRHHETDLLEQGPPTQGGPRLVAR